MEFQGFNKMARLNRDIAVTEKIDGTNAQINIVPVADLLVGTKACFGNEQWAILAGSRTRWITPEDDNYGFAAWVRDNATELLKLGPGQHFGEWWGAGIQRRYGQQEKRFSLFNVHRWCVNAEGLGVLERIETPVAGAPWGTPPVISFREGPACCLVVPTLYRGSFDTSRIDHCLYLLQSAGSFAAPGFMKPEGIVVYHTAAKQMFKVTLDNDALPKTLVR